MLRDWVTVVLVLVFLRLAPIDRRANVLAVFVKHWLLFLLLLHLLSRRLDGFRLRHQFLHGHGLRFGFGFGFLRFFLYDGFGFWLDNRSRGDGLRLWFRLFFHL